MITRCDNWGVCDVVEEIPADGAIRLCGRAFSNNGVVIELGEEGLLVHVGRRMRAVRLCGRDWDAK